MKDLEKTLVNFLNEYAVPSEHSSIHSDKPKAKVLNGVSVDVLAKDLSVMLKKRGIIK